MAVAPQAIARLGLSVDALADRRFNPFREMPCETRPDPRFADRPIDFRQMWAWLRDPHKPAPDRGDVAVRPWFGEDLIVA